MDMEEIEHLNISTLQNLNKELKDSVNEWFRTQFTIDQFPDLVEAAKSNDISRQHYGIIGIRRLCANMDPPIDQLIDAEMVPRIVEFLRNDEEPHLQMESTWIMANFSTGNSTQVQTFVDLGGVHCLIKLLKSGVKETQENAMWTLGNIAADHDRFKDTIFKHGGLEAILDLIKTKANLEQKLGAMAVWGFKHLCRYISQKSFAKMKPVIPVLCQIITQHNDDNVLSEAIITLGSLVATDSALAIDAKVEFQTSEVLIPKILQLLYDVDTNRKDRRDVSFFLLHLIKHYPFQSDQVINNHHFIDMLIKLAIRLAGELKSNVIQTLSILIKNANSAGASNLVDSGILDYFIFLLDSTDAKTLQIALEAIDSILSKGSDFLSRVNQYLDILEDRGGVAKIENLQEHSDETVYHKALKILEKYFDLESLI